MKSISSVIFILSVIFAGTTQAQELRAYELFLKNGEKVDFQNLVSQSAIVDVVLFGELHNNPISHWLQLELTKALFEIKKDKLVLGAEMFESDNQLMIDEYFSGLINERNFKADARFWKNYETDIKPVVEFARENNLKYIATNIPRRYASLVSRRGFEGLEELNEDAKQYIAPLPVAYNPELPGYKAMLEMSGMPAHSSNENFPKAQAIKDATMAHFILANFNKGNTFIHFHGTYHSNNFEGIVWYLKRPDKNLKMITIATVEQQSVETLEEKNLNIADFIIAVPATMTKTY